MREDAVNVSTRVRFNLGFTLVELVTTIMLVAILSVVVLPRLMTSSSYSAFTLRDEFISELRKAQLLAMTNSDRCFQVDVTATQYQTSVFQNDCVTLVRRTLAQGFQGGATLSLLSSGSNSFTLRFDGDGRIAPACNGACIEVVADDTLQIAVESEGYIHGR